MFSISVFAQDKGDFRLGLYHNTNSAGKYLLPQLGISGELFVSKSISLNYKYSLGMNSDRELMGHVNISTIGVALSALFVYELAPYIFLIPEGVSYHSYPNERIEIAPYINPLGAELNMYDDFPILLSCSFGINFHFKPSEKFSISPNIGAMLLYKTGEIQPGFGISLHYNFENLIF